MLNFPNSPTLNDVWEDPNGVNWEFNGEMWQRLIPVAKTGEGELPIGGENGQRLSKRTNTDFDTEWSYINVDGGIF